MIPAWAIWIVAGLLLGAAVALHNGLDDPGTPLTHVTFWICTAAPVAAAFLYAIGLSSGRPVRIVAAVVATVWAVTAVVGLIYIA